jgi:hypothetical protein
MKFELSPIRDDTPCETRHDWLNAWLKHDSALKKFTEFIYECFETCPDISPSLRWKLSEQNALAIIDDVYCGRFKTLKQYPIGHIPLPPESEETY